MSNQPRRGATLGLLGITTLLFSVPACSGTATPSAQTNGGTTAASGGTSSERGGAQSTGGSSASSVGGNAAGGSNTGGASPSSVGGNAAGGSNTGGRSTGGASASSAGRLSTGGSATGGASDSGGANTGGRLSVTAGGKATGGSSTVSTGGTAMNTGGKATGGSTAVSTGGMATGGNNGTAGAAATSSILEPTNGALLGMYYGDASIAATATKLGLTPRLHLTYYAFSDDWTTGNTTADFAAGRVPFVNWELFGATLDDIAGGTYDTLITQRAAAAKRLGQKFFVDFGAEMNGDWSPWSGALNGESSAKYLAAYRHVHDLFVAAGATNVLWAFCPNVTSSPIADWNEPLDYYPGDSYVDWMCVDGYNWGTSTTWGTWQSFYQVFKDIYPVLATKNKPIIIGEMASTELGGDKAAWIAQIIPTMKANFPLLKGLVWFDINKETDWRVSSSSASEAAFKAMANDPWFVR